MKPAQPALMSEPRDHASRVRTTRSPFNFRLSDWIDILRRVVERFTKERLSLVAAGVAFYAFLALVPALAALASIYGFFADPVSIERHLIVLRGFLPDQAYETIKDQVVAIVRQDRQSVGFTSVFGLLIATWTAKAGVNALMSGLNIAYREREDRGLVESFVVSWLLTLVLIVFVSVVLGTIAGAPLALEFLALGHVTETAVGVLRWLLATALVVISIGLIYRVGPSRRGPAVGWLSSGAIAATIIWAAASVALSIYVSHVSDYEAVYGTLGAIVVLLLWFWMSALAVLIGAKLNAEMELQTAADTTHGRDRPMGMRGAYVADNVGGDDHDQTV